jgi:hypothetical protein
MSGWPVSGAAGDCHCCLILEDEMQWMLKVGGFAGAGLLTLAAIAVRVAVGVRPIIGPRSRELTDRCFDRTPSRLARGRYLVFPMNRFINAIPQPITAPVPTPDRRDPVGYGNYLTRLGACRDCHTPTDAQHQPIAALEFSGGFVLTGPYGQVASRNLTRAPSGIPYYNADLFVEVMRTGMVKARRVHDAMPWRALGQQTEEDLRAMFAFLQTVTPVAHRVDNTLPPTPCPVCGGIHGGGDTNLGTTPAEHR